MKAKLKKQIIKYIEDHPVKIDWSNDDVDVSIIKEIATKGRGEFESELWNMNVDYLFDMEGYVFSAIEEEFDVVLKDEYMDEFRDYIIHDLNLKQLYSKVPETNYLLYAYSNYDACNSFDEPYTKSKETYLGDIYSRIRHGVKRADFAQEFYDGAFGGSLFAFLFSGSYYDYLEMKEQINNAEFILIPKGTSFGFHSSFQGSASAFEKTTYRNMKLKMNGETEYDSFELECDLEIHYGLHDVFGRIDPIGNTDITDIEISEKENK